MNVSKVDNYRPMLAAFAFMAIGMFLLLRNLEVIHFVNNWWALFMLIPIAYLLSSAFRLRRENAGAFPPEARNSLVTSGIIACTMLIFLLELSWREMWPLFLILVGLGMVWKARA
jgi:hypothetical protein